MAITSAQNARVKLVRALSGRAKDRREEHAFIAEGVRLVEEARRAGWPFRFVLHTGDLGVRGGELLRTLASAGVATDEVDEQLFRTLTDTENPQGILAVLEEHTVPSPGKPDFVLILDAIRDPGNMGTLLRSADAAGAQAVWLAPDCADAFSPKVMRAGMGAHFRIPVQSMSWAAIEGLVRSHSLNAWLADMDGASCWDTDLRKPLALIIGGEAQGAGEQAQALARSSIRIPMRGNIESLNAAVAGSILLFEARRQRSASQ